MTHHRPNGCLTTIFQKPSNLMSKNLYTKSFFSFRISSLPKSKNKQINSYPIKIQRNLNSLTFTNVQSLKQISKITKGNTLIAIFEGLYCEKTSSYHILSHNVSNKMWNYLMFSVVLL